MAEFTPMMQKYLETKEQYKDCILFYRLGDFYEMFFDDAKTASKELELTLTGKSCGMEDRAPMCGVPFHAADIYINRLVAKGYKVAVCEQMEDPRLAKGLVKREVIRVVTPGTNMSETSLEEGRNNYISSIYKEKEMYSVATADVTTGYFCVTEIDSEKKLIDELVKFAPVELIYPDIMEQEDSDFFKELKNRLNTALSPLEDWYYPKNFCYQAICEHFHVNSLSGLGLSDYTAGINACGAMLTYLKETQKNDLGNMLEIHPYQTGAFMILDSATRRNLELCETMREKRKIGSLLWVLDKTKTAMGARLLRSSIEQPLVDPEAIERRLDAVEELNNNLISRDELREYLNPVYDLERLIGRITYQTANPRDLIAFRSSVEMLPHIQTALGDFHSEELSRMESELDPLTDLARLIGDSIVDDPPLAYRDGDIIKEGYSPEVDELRAISKDGKSFLARIEEEERDKTGIKNLRIKYNKVFGYYLEVTNSFLSMVPDYFIRKQTLTNGERFITPELKTLEEKILGAQERLSSLEYEIFCNVRDTISAEVSRIQKTARQIAKIDMYTSLSYVAEHNHYVRPKMTKDGVISIVDGRHPVVEKMMDQNFIQNDTYLDDSDSRIAIITGPNMAGKSTYMRQVALITLMAQVGSFVPAKEASISVCDRIFTRVGASDDLASGQSTFMLEMNEVANILRNATPKSLLILDEIGRGTSTYDGLAIAWAVVEYLSTTKSVSAKTLFATHYHELTELEGILKNVKNFCISVQENGDDIVFLRKIIRGGADRSYGIQVAKLAGVPNEVIARAKQIVDKISEDKAEVTRMSESGFVHSEEEQQAIFEGAESEVETRLKETDLSRITPLEAINLLYELKELAK